MARTDRFYIGMVESGTGLDSSLKPFAIPDNAFQELVNVYVFRGRVRKRFGSSLMNEENDDPMLNQLYSRVRINIATTDGSGAASTFTPKNDAGVLVTDPDIGQLFSIGDVIFTVYQDGLTKSTGAGTLTYTFATGAVVVAGATATTDIYFYPATPIVGIVNYYNGTLSDEPFLVFDQNYSYEFDGTGFERIDGENQPDAAIWEAASYQGMWGYTYRGILNSEFYVFVTNYNAPDRMRYYDGIDWNFLSPVLNGISRLITSRIVVPFKDRLVCLNTIEGSEGSVETTSNGTTGNFTFNIGSYVFTWGQTIICGTTTYTIVDAGGGLYTVTVLSNAVGPNPPSITATFVVSLGTGTFTSSGDVFNLGLDVYYLPNTAANQALYVNRCRFSQNGSPVAANAFEDNVAGLGGYVDAPTKEQIITSEFIRDRLIVYFESSTWELIYTGNEILPFRWQQINTELGAQSTFSIVPFDKVAIGIGNNGIHACNGTNVERIDNKIPDYVFQISKDNNGLLRVLGIRDYYNEMIYWSIPTIDIDDIFPNKILVYNYKNGSWAYFEDSVTAFGYFNDQAGVRWNSTELTWEEYGNAWFAASANAKIQKVLAGNQEGFVFICDNDVESNAESLQITNISISSSIVTITCINHNLQVVASDNDNGNGDYIIIRNCQGVTGLNDNIYAVRTTTDVDTFTIQLDAGEIASGTYLGGGTLARVSNYSIITKQYNFYASEGRNAAINKVDFLVDKTQNGQVTVNYAVSSSTQNVLANARALGSLVGTGVLKTSPYALIPLENSQDRLWHPIYPMANGECIQFEIYMADNIDRTLSQIRNPSIAFSAFTINAFIVEASRTSYRLQ